MKSTNKLDEYYTLEKHLHFFGSILLHYHVMQANMQTVGGYWQDIMLEMQGLVNESMNAVGIQRTEFENRIKNLTIQSVSGNFAPITTHFPKANVINETGK